ncbi:S-adenosyl-L-methionine-dependent methyltransferase [Microthyrium microscopicum]|uniref:S-adenosyl-L-methionine-dependent methyltransferase n=1 Tax=Microthyrium microscopicum TaxID=703497 RepID=A0A6A6UKK1_9PEZI|nr:S-adenosyl-L-methionine-dependent methyltransferase [Microthyrium microscopicum]
MDTATLVQTLNDAAAKSGSASPPEKMQIFEACSKLLSTVEPFEHNLMNLIFSPVKCIALRLAIDMQLFDVGAKALERGENITLEQLSTETKCQALLIKRIMRVLVNLKLFNEVDQDVFQPQRVVAMYKTESMIAQVILHFTSHQREIVMLPEFFAERGYNCPDDAFDSPFQYAVGTKQHQFEWIAERPRMQHAFNITMTMRSQGKFDVPWHEMFPIDQLFTQKMTSDTFMVDVGGGIGHHMITFKERYPKVPGKLVVQDIPAVIETVKDLPDGIEAMSTDFLKSQPIQGANVYFLAHILHDWPDKQAKLILEHIRDAMGPDSVVLLNESVMPEQGVPFNPALADIVMMAAYSAGERTEKQYQELLDSAGLKLVKVWKSPKSVGKGSLDSAIVEARLKYHSVVGGVIEIISNHVSIGYEVIIKTS